MDHKAMRKCWVAAVLFASVAFLRGTNCTLSILFMALYADVTLPVVLLGVGVFVRDCGRVQVYVQ